MFVLINIHPWNIKAPEVEENRSGIMKNLTKLNKILTLDRHIMVNVSV